MSECTHDCSTCGNKCSEAQEPESLIQPQNEFSNVKKVIAVVSGKGGVGKSMVTSLMAVAMQRRGYNTAVLDADVTGPSIPRCFGVTERAQGSADGLLPAVTNTGIEIMSTNMLLASPTDPVVWRGPVISGVVTQFWTDVVWDEVDWMFVDMPPGTGDVSLTVFQSLPIDGIIIVSTPQELVSMIVEKAVNMAKMLKLPVLALVENMSYLTCPDCGRHISVFGESRVESTASAMGIETTARLPIDPKLASLCDAGKIEDVEGNWLDGIADMLEKL